MESLKRWHHAVQKRDTSILEDILADDVTFYSPAIWAPQNGKTLTKMYLIGAMLVLGGEEFEYVKEIVSGNMACLEFTTKIDDKIINGVDIITFDESGKIIEFKVMVRPYSSLVKLKEKMFELLQQMPPK